jgi:3-oxoacyl-[acyl-carrier protein] reductase
MLQQSQYFDTRMVYSLGVSKHSVPQLSNHWSEQGVIMEQKFSKQVAIVTGGADGIGKAVAQRLASEGAGVTIFDLNDERAAETVAEFDASGLSVDSAHVDVSNEDSVKDAIHKVVQDNSRLDIVINCAGIVGPTSTNILDYDTAEYDKVYQVNLRGSFLMTKYGMAPMLERDYGRILLIASIAGKDGNPGMCGYSSTKAGVIGLVKGIGKEYAETGVTINGLAPAVVRTPMVANTHPDMVKYMTDKIPMKRTGSLDEVSAMCAFIVSRECSFCTGAIFDLSGGRATY